MKQADALLKMNPVDATGVVEIDRQLLTEWLAGEDSAVPLRVLDCVLTVPVRMALANHHEPPFDYS